VDEFCRAIFNDLFESLIQPIADQYEDNQGNQIINFDILWQDIAEEIRVKLSIDEEHISMNALEVVTRQCNNNKGLS
jgi:hypothetical protein